MEATFSANAPAGVGPDRPRCVISRTALLHNVKVLRRFMRESTRICAVIKADAYGHGASIVADTLTNFSSGTVEGPAVDALAVATFDEAAALGEQDAPIQVLRPVEATSIGQQREQIERAIREGWTITLCSSAAALDIARLAAGCARRASVQVMIDTGMAREGAPPQTVNWIVSAVESMPSLKLTGLCTHFVNSEDPNDPATADQFAAFEATTLPFVKRNPKGITRHAANSGAVFFAPLSHGDMVRPGLALLGIDPTGRPSVDRPVRPAMKWLAPLLLVRNVKAGQAVGYGQTWKAARDTRIGLVPVGYADGYLRCFSSKASVMVHNRPAPVVGRVSMDYITVDLANVPQATPGDDVTLIDSDPLSPASVYRLADIAQTIPYEVFCRVGSRVARVVAEPEEAGPEDRPEVTVYPNVMRLSGGRRAGV